MMRYMKNLLAFLLGGLYVSCIWVICVLEGGVADVGVFLLCLGTGGLLYVVLMFFINNWNEE